MKRVICRLLLGISMTSALSLRAADTNTVIKLGILDPLRGEAARYNTEFRKYDRMAAYLNDKHIEPTLVEFGSFNNGVPNEEGILKLLKPFHVVLIINNHEDCLRLNDALKACVPGVKGGLERYVKEGGGLFLFPQGLRYPNSDDEKYWNLIYEGLGLSMMHEGLFDSVHSFKGRDCQPAMFWITQNIKTHAITEGVKRLALPAYAVGMKAWPGVEAIRYSPEWEIVVSGDKEAKSYQAGEDNVLNPDKEGTYKSEPPIVGCRAFGKGRVVCYPLTHVHAGRNFNIPGWDNTVETSGNRGADQPSFSMQLTVNAIRWLAEPALADAGFGSNTNAPYAEVVFPPSVEWDTPVFVPVQSNLVKAVFGAVSSYGGGKGSVKDYVNAAKAAGVSILVFADPLEKLTPETLKKLKEDCVSASAGNDFFACPGIEFTDGTGLRWALWGEKVTYPEKEFTETPRTYRQWDGAKVLHRGKYMDQTQFCQNGLLDYKQMKTNGQHPENMWWFFYYFPWVYENGKLTADNVADFLHGLSDLRWASIASYTRVDDPARVSEAAGVCYTGFKDIASAKTSLNSMCSGMFNSWAAGQFVSQGPVILFWNMINSQMEENWKKTRGCQRARARFVVRAEDGIVDVKVHDAERGVYRRFVGNGEKEMVREFEGVNDRTRWLTLEVTDTKGKRAFSWVILFYCYKQGLFRCGDNLNILGATGLLWHPDRNEMIPVAKGFDNSFLYSIQGVDGGGPLCPVPYSFGDDFIVTDKGEYPLPWKQGVMQGKVLKVLLNSHNIQIVAQSMTQLSEPACDDKRPQPALASIPRDMGPNEYFEREHTIYSPASRTDWFVSWNYRRPMEGLKDYRGGIIWNEGKIKFKKDLKLNGNCPILLVRMMCQTDVSKESGDTMVATDASGKTVMVRLTDPKGKIGGEEFFGRIRPGGYVTLMPTLIGYQEFIAPAGSDFAYAGFLPGWLSVGLGKNGQEVKAGTELTYRFAMASIATDKVGTAILEDTVAAMNMDGGTNGYPIVMKTGTLADAMFFFTAKAEKNETAFKVGPRRLIVDLPIRVQGLKDNGCAAVYSSAHPWFRYVPVQEDGTAYFQEAIDQATEMWVGNIVTANNEALKITVVVDGQKEGKKPFIEVHNPTDAAIEAELASPPNTPVFGGMTGKVSVPAGNNARYEINGKQLAPVH